MGAVGNKFEVVAVCWKLERIRGSIPVALYD
jgi:hypothetical protein